MKTKAQPTSRDKIVAGIITIGIVVAIIMAISGKSSSTDSSSGSCDIGKQMTLSNSGHDIAGADTRSLLVKVEEAKAANDSVGVSQYFSSGEVSTIGEGSTVLLLDSAILGERQVRVVSDPMYPDNNGRAVWVDSSALPNC